MRPIVRKDVDPATPLDPTASPVLNPAMFATEGANSVFANGFPVVVAGNDGSIPGPAPVVLVVPGSVWAQGMMIAAAGDMVSTELDGFLPFVEPTSDVFVPGAPPAPTGPPP